MKTARTIGTALTALLLLGAGCESGGNGHASARATPPETNDEPIQRKQATAQRADESADGKWQPEQRIDPGEVPPADSRLELSEEKWRERLTKQEFHILRENGTERAGSGDLLAEKRKGVYYCAACGNPVFSSRTKFKSGTGWPSFFAPYHPKRIGKSVDKSHGITRTEIHCARCGGHLGHVFDDGPEPTGKRYCINSAALDFKSVEQIASRSDE